VYRYVLVAVLVMPMVAFAADVSVSGHVSVKDQHTSVDVVFTNSDKAVIQNYYHAQREESKSKGKHGKKVPPGLAKKGGLPPGIAKRQRMPEDVHYEFLPRELEANLTPLPSPNYVRVRVGQDFAIMDKKSRVVFDLALGLVVN
jgi:hypothetical protein